MHVCYWIVGLDTDRPEIALDLRNDDGSLAAETHTIRLDDVTKAHLVARSASIAFVSILTGTFPQRNPAGNQHNDNRLCPREHRRTIVGGAECCATQCWRGSRIG